MNKDYIHSSLFVEWRKRVDIWQNETTKIWEAAAPFPTTPAVKTFTTAQMEAQKQDFTALELAKLVENNPELLLETPSKVKKLNYSDHEQKDKEAQ
jgi:hypothetical protein